MSHTGSPPADQNTAPANFASRPNALSSLAQRVEAAVSALAVARSGVCCSRPKAAGAEEALAFPFPLPVDSNLLGAVNNSRVNC
jgi:hypothetical protein